MESKHEKEVQQQVFTEGSDEQSKMTEEKTSIGLEQNVAGLLCYLAGFITGIIFFLLEKENRFVRFHAMQSIIISGALFVINIILSFIPIIGLLMSLLVGPLSFILWIVLMIKAYQGKWFKLPIIGDIAENQLDKIKID